MGVPPFTPQLLLLCSDILGHCQPEHCFQVLEGLHDVLAAAALSLGERVVYNQGAFAPVFPRLKPILEETANDVAILDTGVLSVF